MSDSCNVQHNHIGIVSSNNDMKRIIIKTFSELRHQMYRLMP
jgi:hypothetical protein